MSKMYLTTQQFVLLLPVAGNQDAGNQGGGRVGGGSRRYQSTPWRSQRKSYNKKSGPLIADFLSNFARLLGPNGFLKTCLRHVSRVPGRHPFFTGFCLAPDTMFVGLARPRLPFLLDFFSQGSTKYLKSIAPKT